MAIKKSTMEIIERLLPTELPTNQELLQAQEEFEKERRRSLMKKTLEKCSQKNNKIKGEVNMSNTVNNLLNQKNNEEVCVTMNKNQILNKLALAVPQNEESILESVNDIHNMIIEVAKETNDYSKVDEMFKSSTKEYLQGTDEVMAKDESGKYIYSILDKAIMNKFLSVGQQIELQYLNEQTTDKKIDTLIELFLVVYDNNRKQYMKTLPVSEKMENFFVKTNEGVAEEFKLSVFPANMYEAKSYIDFLMTKPTEKQITRVLKLDTKVGKGITREMLISLSREDVSNLIGKLDSLIPVTEGQLKFITNLLKQLGEVYVAEKYESISSSQATKLIEELNQKLLVKLSSGSYNLEQVKKMKKEEITKLINQFKVDNAVKFFDDDTKEKLGSILSSLGL